MSNPIKAIIIIKEGSGGGDDGQAGCCMFLIISLIILGIFLDWGFIPISILCSIIFIAYLTDKMAIVVISSLIICGGIWGFVKLQEKDKDEKASNSKSTTHVTNSNSSIPNENKSEESASTFIEVNDLSSIDYPSSFTTTSDSQFLAAGGEETVIPANSRITILKRTPAGMLTLEVNGKKYLGFESRLTGNLKK